MVKISNYQFFCLIILFEIGSSTLFPLGIEARQDAWIVVLVALLMGLGITLCYTALQKEFPQKNYVEILTAVLGKGLGITVALAQGLNWLWISGRNVREFGGLINTTILQNTPLIIILLVFILASIYVLTCGIEVFGRTGEIMMPIIVIFLISIFIMTVLSGSIDLKQLKPVGGSGFKTILGSAWPTYASFPFGETIVFSMFWPYVEQQNKIRKTTLSAILLSGILLTISIIIIISSLGYEYTKHATIPLIEVIRLINIGDILTNLDAFGTIIIFIGGLFKATTHLAGYALVAKTVFKIKNYKLLVVICGLILLWFAIAFEPSYTFHQIIHPSNVKFMFWLFSYAIPIQLLLIYWIKRKYNRVIV